MFFLNYLRDYILLIYINLNIYLSREKGLGDINLGLFNFNLGMIGKVLRYWYLN